jgi:hypothetical protein
MLLVADLDFPDLPFATACGGAPRLCACETKERFGNDQEKALAYIPNVFPHTGNSRTNTIALAIYHEDDCTAFRPPLQ